MEDKIVTLPFPGSADPDAGGVDEEDREREAAVESILFVSGEPVHVDRICAALDVDRPAAERILRRLMDRCAYERRGIRILRMEDRWQMCSSPDYGDAVRKAFEIRKTAKLSQPALEVLTIIAYYQPTTRAYVDQLRGVDSGYTVGLLLERGLIEVCGQLQAPGRPRLYRTTERFLRTFHLNSLEDLPDLPEEGMEVQLRLDGMDPGRPVRTAGDPARSAGSRGVPSDSADTPSEDDTSLQDSTGVSPEGDTPPPDDADASPEDDASPEGDTSLPDDADEPPGDDTSPLDDTDDPSEDDTSPPDGAETPSGDDTSPPDDADASPEGDTPPPDDADASPEDGASLPGDADEPPGDDTSPPDDTDDPTGDDTSPPDDADTPPEDDTSPPDDADASPEDDTSPSDGSDELPVDDTPPSADADELPGDDAPLSGDGGTVVKKNGPP